MDEAEKSLNKHGDPRVTECKLITNNYLHDVSQSVRQMPPTAEAQTAVDLFSVQIEGTLSTDSFGISREQ